ECVPAGATFPSDAHGHQVGRLAGRGAVPRIPYFRRPPASPGRPALEKPVRFRGVDPASFVVLGAPLRVAPDGLAVAQVASSRGGFGARLQSGEPECEWSAIDLPAHV